MPTIELLEMIAKQRFEIDNIKQLLKKIEWNGPSDYSIGVRTCPCCGRRGNVPKGSQWYQGHSEDCELNNILMEKDQHAPRNNPNKPIDR